jgi:hypothetical protein
VLLCGCGSDERVCTLIGCDSVAELDVLSANDSATIYDTTVEACLNQYCATGPMPNIPYYWGQVLSGDVFATVDVEPVPPGSGVTVTARVWYLDPSKNVPTADGDVYTGSVFAVDGTMLGSGTWTATYSAPYYPNGSACGPRCVFATLTRVP